MEDRYNDIINDTAAIDNDVPIALRSHGAITPSEPLLDPQGVDPYNLDPYSSSVEYR